MSRSFVIALVISAAIGHAAENADSAILQDFAKRVSDYVQLRRNIESTQPRLKATLSPEKISEQQHRLTEAIRDARKNARPGDIFTPPIAAEFRRLIGIAMQADGKRIETSLRHAEPVELRLRVNDSYPASVPLQSTPPTLLMNLPRLPQQIEYRVAGRDLILLDGSANLVVDLIENAIP